MFTLIAMGTGVAYLYSMIATLAPGVFPPAFRGHNGAVAVFFEAAAVIAVLVLQSLSPARSTRPAASSCAPKRSAATPCWRRSSRWSRRRNAAARPIQRLADRVASWFAPTVIAVAVLAFAAWATFGPEPRFAFGLVAAVFVLIIACPCAPGLATPSSRPKCCPGGRAR